MKFSIFFAAAVLAGGVAFSGSAGATVVDILYDPSDSSPTPIGSRPIQIDFRTSDWNAANNASSFKLLNVNKSTVGEDTGFFDIWVTPNTNTIWKSSDDGLGVRGGEDDEIQGTENLRVDFYEAGSTTQHYAVPLFGVYLTDLFDYRNDGDNGRSEKANVELTLSDLSTQNYTFSSENDLYGNQNNGEYYGAFGTALDPAYLVYSVLFESSGETTTTNDEFSVAGFRAWPVTVIPLPAALPLYGTGLALMGFVGWRKRRKAAQA